MTDNIAIRINTALMPCGYRAEALLPNGNPIGFATVALDGEKAKLSDLIVYDKYVYAWPNLVLIPVDFRIRRKRNYRNLGIGTRLLSAAIEHAKTLGCIQMTGHMNGDLDRLIPFYTSFGFVVNGIHIRLDLHE